MIEKEIQNYEEKIKRLLVSKIEKEEDKAIDTIKKNPRYFYSFAKRKTPPLPPLPPYQRLIKWGGVRAKDKYLVAPLRRPPPGGGVFGGGPKTPIFGVFGGTGGGVGGLDERGGSKMEKTEICRSCMSLLLQ